jgi:hypothetical protein
MAARQTTARKKRKKSPASRTPQAATAWLREFVDAEGLRSCLRVYEEAARGRAAGTTVGDAAPSEAWILAWLRALDSVLDPPRTAAECGLSWLGERMLRSCIVDYARKAQGGRQYGTVREKPSPRSPAPEYESSFGGKKRSAASLCAQGAPRAVRGALYSFCWDVDICNCHPSLLSVRSTKLGVSAPRLVHYASRAVPSEGRESGRESWIRELSSHYGFAEDSGAAKDAVKLLVTSLVYGGSHAAWAKRQGLAARADEPHPWVRELSSELLELRRAMFASPRFSDYSKRWMRHLLSEGLDQESAERSLYSRILQILEDDALHVITRAVRRCGGRVMSLVFDGCMIVRNPSTPLADMLAKVRRDLDREEVPVDVVEKPLPLSELFAARAPSLSERDERT